MADISKCLPKKFLPKCDKCYRRRANPSYNQSYSDFYNECKDGKYKYFIEWDKNV